MKRALGFSLVEIAIVLVIVGLIMGTVISAMNAASANAAIRATKMRMDTIQDALQQFYNANGRLPCPAGPTLAEGSALSGQENTPSLSSATAQNVCPATNGVGRFGANSPAGRVFKGVVPWKTLGLSKDISLDGNDSRLDYYVSASAIATWATPDYINTRSRPARGMIGIMQVNDATGAEVTNPTARAVVALVSHGKNKLGAYQDSGVMTPVAGSDTNEAENNDSDAILVSRDFVNAGYDDTVQWMTAAAVTRVAAQTPSMADAQAAVRSSMSALTNSFMVWQSVNRTGAAGSGSYTRVGSSGAAINYTFATGPFAGCGANPVTVSTYQVSVATTFFPGLSTTDTYDPWGMPIRYAYASTLPSPFTTTTAASCSNMLALISYGPDRAIGGSDDVTYLFPMSELFSKLGY